MHDALRLYSRTLYRYPLFFILVPLVLTGFVPLVVLYFNPVHLTQNAEIGFDTKDTDYSGPRVAWAKLQQQLTATNRIPFANPRPLIPQKQSVAQNASSPTQTDLTRSSHSRKARGWADDLLFAVQNVPCYDAPIPLMDHLSQFVVELPSYNSLFEMEFLQKMCSLHHNISTELAAFDNFTPYRNVWNVANYMACLSPNFLINCTEITVSEVATVRAIVEGCKPYRDQLIQCKIECGEQCSECAGVPKNCSSQMMFDLFYRVLPRDLEAEPFLLNTFLPAFTLTGYLTQNMRIPIELYDHLEAGVKGYLKREGINLKGLLMDTKRERLLPAAIQDSMLALVATALILTVIALHSRSVTYAIALFVILALSVLAALAIYSLFTVDFPLLNLVIFVLLIAVGTDDAFLLYSSFPDNLNEDSFHECLTHTGATMFLTSFSTAVPFFVNILSNVIVFRCFGLFAGVTTVINWFLVVSFLPAYLVLQRKWCSCLPSIPSFGNFLAFSLQQVLPSVLIQGRFLWMSTLSIMVIGSGFITFHDLRLPEYNPLQLFTSDNLHEWYDNNAEKNFEFVARKIALPLFARLVWGVQPIESTARFRADAFTPLMSNPQFSFDSVASVRAVAATLSSARHQPFINHTEEYWPERFFKWSAKYPCAKGFICCNIDNPLFTNDVLDFCLRNSTSFLFTSYNDTPIFDSNTFALVGYTALLPTKLKYNHRFGQLSDNFNKLASTAPENGWWAPEWPLMSTWFDLQRSIISDCRSSAITSIVVVALFAAAQLRFQAIPAVLTCICIIVTSVGVVVLLGWVIGVLEAVILVLVVGLSFDYTLHYGAAIPHNGCPLHRVRKAAAVALVPVSLAASTSFIAGAAMLFSKTHAFFQVGTFLVVVTSVSWLFATFFFLPLLTLTLPKTQKCEMCNAVQCIPLNGRKQ